MIPIPRLKPDGAAILNTALAATGVPGTLAVANAEGILFSGTTGPFDPLKPDSRALKEDDLMWFASTTKLLTSICYLQLVDRGLLTLDTDMRTKFAPLDEAASKIIVGFEKDDTPIYKPNTKPVTLLSLLNLTCGFGMEYGPTVMRHKKRAAKGRGFVNSCKVENLIHTPLCFEPGTSFQYGNSFDWLGLMLPHLTGTSSEDYLQDNILKPLGLKATTFFPFGPDWDDRLMPLRWRRSDGVFQAIDRKSPAAMLMLPRKEEIEYVVGGGAAYSTSHDYAVILQHLLAHYVAIHSDTPRPANPILSDKSVESLFNPTLPESAKEAVAECVTHVLGEAIAPGEADWTTATAIYTPHDGRRRPCLGMPGRHAGSIGWGGAAGTLYWIDLKAGIAVAMSTQVLPGTGLATVAFKDTLEAAVYVALEGGGRLQAHY